MPPYAMETVVGSLAAANTATAQPYAPGNGQSFNVRATNGTTVAHLEALWSNATDVGFPRIRSPRLHDDVVGVQVQDFVGNLTPLEQECFSQELFSQDSLTVEKLFAAAPVAGHIEQIGFQVYYDDLPGVSANIWSYAQVKARVQSYYGAFVSVTGNATIGQWGVGQPINSVQDNFKANSLYAILGYTVDSACTAVAFQGTDIGNLFVGGPGAVDPLVTRRWFPYLEETTGMPSIPVINSQNKGATLLSVFTPAASTAHNVGVIYAYLGPQGA